MMNIIDPNPEVRKEMQKEMNAAHTRGKITGGLILVVLGLLLLGREMGMQLPLWLFSWQMFLITIGVYIAIKKAFRGMSWMILILLGGVFMVRDFVPGMSYTNLIWPIVIILFGIYIVFKPKRKSWKMDGNFDANGKYDYNRDRSCRPEPVTSADDFLEINSVFGGVERIVVSKNFKGGEINSVFGGAEINLSNADITEKAQLEINAVFGGVRLVIPPNWGLQSELTAFMGSVEDKRPIDRSGNQEFEKILVLKGHAVFGGIEIQSY